MNSLSWMIYFAGVSGSISSFLFVLTGICTVALVICAVSYLTMGEEPMIFSWEDKEAKRSEHNKTRSLLGKYVPHLVIAIISFGSIASLLPSRNTVYAIAASEMGEGLISTPTAGKAASDLAAWLDRQIDGKKPQE